MVAGKKGGQMKTISEVEEGCTISTVLSAGGMGSFYLTLVTIASQPVAQRARVM